MKKKVLVEIRPFAFKVQFSSSQEVVSTAVLKEEALKHLRHLLNTESKKFIIDKMRLFDLDVLNESDIRPGMIVKTSYGEIGIITKISNEKKSVTVALPGHRLWTFCVQELRKSNASFKAARCIRLDFALKNDLWHEGDSGYIQLKNVNGFIPVVIGGTSKGMTSIHTIYEINGVPKILNIPTSRLPFYITEFTVGETRSDYPSPDEIISVIRDDEDIKSKTKLEQIEIMNKKRLELLRLIELKKQAFDHSKISPYPNSIKDELIKKEGAIVCQ